MKPKITKMPYTRAGRCWGTIITIDAGANYEFAHILGRYFYEAVTPEGKTIFKGSWKQGAIDALKAGLPLEQARRRIGAIR